MNDNRDNDISKEIEDIRAQLRNDLVLIITYYENLIKELEKRKGYDKIYRQNYTVEFLN